MDHSRSHPVIELMQFHRNDGHRHSGILQNPAGGNMPSGQPCRKNPDIVTQFLESAGCFAQIHP